MKFDHFVIIRFALDIFDKPCSDEWIEQRIPIFKRVCLPSLEAQTNKKFRVILLVKQGFKHFNRLPSGDYEIIEAGNPWGEDLKRILLDRVRTCADWIITTRMDNDDAIERGFIDRVQSVFCENQVTTAVNLQNGLILKDAALFYIRYLSNMFISVISKKDVMATCYDANHQDMFRKYPMVNITHGGPFWLINRHPQSLSYRHKEQGLRPTEDYSLLKRFSNE